MYCRQFSAKNSTAIYKFKVNQIFILNENKNIFIQVVTKNVFIIWELFSIW